MSATAKSGETESARIAGLMGLRNSGDYDDVRLAEKIGVGLPVTAAAAIVRKIDPDSRWLTISRIIPKASYFRKKKTGQPLDRGQSETVFAVAKVYAELLRLFHGDKALADRFLNRPHPLLGGKTPLEMTCLSSAGADAVMKLLARADAGIAA